MTERDPSPLPHAAATDWERRYRAIPLAEEGRIRLGLDPEFAESLGERFVGLELAPPGTRVALGESFGFVHCADATHDLRAPRDLIVAAVNPRAIANPGLTRLSPTGDGWLIEIEGSGM